MNPVTVLDTVTLMATKHMPLGEMTGGFERMEKKRKTGHLGENKTCHVVREVVVLVLLHQGKSGLTTAKN